MATYQTLFQCGFILNERTKLESTASDIEQIHEDHHRLHRGGSLQL